MMDYVCIREKYLGAIQGAKYKVIAKGRDWTLVKIKGKPRYVPTTLTTYQAEPQAVWDQRESRQGSRRGTSKRSHDTGYI